MCSYFFLSTFLATLNTSTSKSKSIGKYGRSKREEEEKKKEKKDEGEEKKKMEKVEVDRKTLSSQIPKKTSPKKPLVPVKEEPSLKKENGKMGNCKYAIHTCYNAT